MQTWRVMDVNIEDKKKTGILLAMTLQMYPFHPMYKASKEQRNHFFRLYIGALDDLTYDDVNAALTKCLRNAKFFPTVAEIYEAAGSIKKTSAGDGDKDAGQAWEEVMQLVRRCHVYKPWTFSTPEVEQAVREFGKQELCELEAEGVNTARAQFQRIYNAVVSRRKERAENKEILKRLGLHMTKTLNSNGRKQLAGGDHHEAMRCL